MVLSRIATVINLIKDIGVIRPLDLDKHGIAREYLNRLCGKGISQDHWPQGPYNIA